MGIFSARGRLNDQGTDGAKSLAANAFVLVTPHFTVLDESQRGELEHALVEDAQLNLLFDANGSLLSDNSSGVCKTLAGLRKADDRYIIVHRNFLRKKRHVCAEVRGGFVRRKSVNDWEKYRLVPLDLARTAKENGLPLDVVLAATNKSSSVDARHGDASGIVLQARRSSIPQIIHQTYANLHIPDVLKQNVQNLKHLNPSWLYRFWSDAEIIDFINDAFGWSVLRVYLSINPQYGAARADLFRYLCVYYYGGVYLDIKSSARIPFNEIINDDDEYLLSYWNNEPGARYAEFGLHPELKLSPRGELQQWHVIAAAQHPLLQRVVETVIENIKSYDPDVNGWGKQAVLRLTGPIAYTSAIYLHLSEHKCRFISAEDCGMEYNVLEDHRAALGGSRHYSALDTPIVI